MSIDVPTMYKTLLAFTCSLSACAIGAPKHLGHCGPDALPELIPADPTKPGVALSAVHDQGGVCLADAADSYLEIGRQLHSA